MLARAVARSLGLDRAQVAEVESAALLHDLGKVAVPDATSIPDLEHLGPAIRAEHERRDGAGYPDGLAGEAIPLASRIAFVCDATTP